MPHNSIIEIMTQANIDAVAGTDTVPIYAWPGAYPLYYLCEDGGVLCPKCVNTNIRLIVDACIEDNDKQWNIIGVEVNYEDQQLQCAHCGERIEPAYPDSETIAIEESEHGIQTD